MKLFDFPSFKKKLSVHDQAIFPAARTYFPILNNAKKVHITPSFPQYLGGNPFWEAHGCPTENFGHDG